MEINKPHPDENIIEWLRKMVRSYRMKEIEYANKRQYEQAIEMREKVKEVYGEAFKLYPHLFRRD